MQIHYHGIVFGPEFLSYCGQRSSRMSTGVARIILVSSVAHLQENIFFHMASGHFDHVDKIGSLSKWKRMTYNFFSLQIAV